MRTKKELDVTSIIPLVFFSDNDDKTWYKWKKQLGSWGFPWVSPSFSHQGSPGRCREPPGPGRCAMGSTGAAGHTGHGRRDHACQAKCNLSGTFYHYNMYIICYCLVYLLVCVCMCVDLSMYVSIWLYLFVYLYNFIYYIKTYHW